VERLIRNQQVRGSNPFGGLITISTVILKEKNKNFYRLIQVLISIGVHIALHYFEDYLNIVENDD
jgi:hypothetical protein